MRNNHKVLKTPSIKFTTQLKMLYFKITSLEVELIRKNNLKVIQNLSIVFRMQLNMWHFKMEFLLVEPFICLVIINIELMNVRLYLIKLNAKSY